MVIVRDGGPDEEPSDVVDATSYCEEIVEPFCAYYLRCARMAANDPDECRGVFLEACNARYEPSFVSLVDDELLTLSRAGIEACAAHLEDVPCEEQILDLDGPCASMWQGTQPEGAACGFDVETFVCAAGTACELGLDFCGTCEAVARDGAPCDVEGVTCTKDSSCVDGVCLARKRVNEPCTPDDRCVLGAQCRDGVCRGPAYTTVGEACDFDTRCPYRSNCVDGECALAGGLGDGCSESAPCDSGGFCDVDQCVELTAQGDACTASAQCQSGSCREGSCAVLPSACILDR